MTKRSAALKAILLPVLLILLFSAHAHAQSPIGAVARIQAGTQTGQEAVTVQGAHDAAPRALIPAAPVHARDIVRTGKGARVEIVLHDNTRITLGPDTTFAFDDFALDTAADRGSASLRLLRGAFRFVSGRVTTMGTTDVAVNTPLATIGIRGTDVWGGFFDPADFGVFLFSGKPVTVANSLGSQVLPPGKGTNLKPGHPPGEVKTWGDARLARAVEAVTFD